MPIPINEIFWIVVVVAALIYLFVDRQKREEQRMTSEYRKAMQRHHDHFVRLYRKFGEDIDPDARRNYDIAMRREKDGEVKPLE